MIRNSSVIIGLTTAGGMCATAIIGIDIGYVFYSGAISATLLCIFCWKNIGTNMILKNINVKNLPFKGRFFYKSVIV